GALVHGAATGRRAVPHLIRAGDIQLSAFLILAAPQLLTALEIPERRHRERREERGRNPLFPESAVVCDLELRADRRGDSVQLSDRQREITHWAKVRRLLCGAGGDGRERVGEDPGSTKKVVHRFLVQGEER